MLNQDKINNHCLQSRLNDLDAIERLKTKCEKECDILEIKCKDKEIIVKLHELADDSLKEIKDDLLIRLSRFNIESFTLMSEIKRIDRVLKLRKVPILND